MLKSKQTRTANWLSVSGTDQALHPLLELAEILPQDVLRLLIADPHAFMDLRNASGAGMAVADCQDIRDIAVGDASLASHSLMCESPAAFMCRVMVVSSVLEIVAG